jgi:hypothetical protein
MKFQVKTEEQPVMTAQPDAPLLWVADESVHSRDDKKFWTGWYCGAVFGLMVALAVGFVAEYFKN